MSLVPILVGTLGTFIGFGVLGGLGQLQVGGWLFGLSWVPIVAGAIGHLTRKY